MNPKTPMKMQPLMYMFLRPTRSDRAPANTDRYISGCIFMGVFGIEHREIDESEDAHEDAAADVHVLAADPIRQGAGKHRSVHQRLHLHGRLRYRASRNR